MYRRGKPQLPNVSARTRSVPLAVRARRALAIAMAALMLGTVAAPATTSLASSLPSASKIIRPALPLGVGDSPVMP